MARFEVFENAFGDGLLLDCQADLLSDLKTRIVVPLIEQGSAPMPASRLNPSFDVGDVQYVMVTQYAAAVETQNWGRKSPRWPIAATRS